MNQFYDLLVTVLKIAIVKQKIKSNMSEHGSEDSSTYLDMIRNDDIIRQMQYAYSLRKSSEHCDTKDQHINICNEDDVETSDDEQILETHRSLDRLAILKEVFISKDIVGFVIADKEPTPFKKGVAEIAGFVAQSGLIVTALVVTISVAIYTRNLAEFRRTVMILTIINIVILFIQTLISKMGVASSLERERVKKEADQRKREADQRKREDDRHRALLKAILMSNMRVPDNVNQFLQLVNSNVDSRVDNHLSQYRLDKRYDLYDLLTDAEKKHQGTISP